MKEEKLVVNTLVFDEVFKRGKYQIELLEDIRSLGVTKIEIRREYLRDKEELAELKEKAEKLGVELFYSVPDILFKGKLLAKDRLETYFEEYHLLGAKQLKIVLGYAEEISKEDVEVLKSLMSEKNIHHITLENDQSPYSTPKTMQQLVRQLRKAGIDAGLTFDTGNFLLIGVDPLEAAKRLKDEVTFVHLKNVEAETGEMTLIDEGDIPMFEVMAVFSNEVNQALEYFCGRDAFATVQKEITKMKEQS